MVAAQSRLSGNHLAYKFLAYKFLELFWLTISWLFLVGLTRICDFIFKKFCSKKISSGGARPASSGGSPVKLVYIVSSKSIWFPADNLSEFSARTSGPVGKALPDQDEAPGPLAKGIHFHIIVLLGACIDQGARVYVYSLSTGGRQTVNSVHALPTLPGGNTAISENGNPAAGGPVVSTGPIPVSLGIGQELPRV